MHILLKLPRVDSKGHALLLVCVRSGDAAPASRLSALPTAARGSLPLQILHMMKAWMGQLGLLSGLPHVDCFQFLVVL